MPSTGDEEASLLASVKCERMQDTELKNLQPWSTPCNEFRVKTEKGEILVAVQGDRSKPAIITYHDLGLNYISGFQAFFNYVDMRSMLENFCVYHVNAPGQEEGAGDLPDNYVYPTMDELAHQINFVLNHFGVRSFIGFGVGVGANILMRFAITMPHLVNALVLVNCTSTAAGWIEWGYQKMNSWTRSKGMSQGMLDYLMWHHFGNTVETRNYDLVQVHKLHFSRNVNPANLAMFIDAFVRRSDLNIARESRTVKAPVLNITGALSPHVEDTVTLNGRLDPTRCTWMKISDCCMVLEEQPSKISEAARLFLQGEGFSVKSSNVH